ncbi:MAG: hypothetical protein WA973_06370 [Mesorhizobium sp.]
MPEGKRKFIEDAARVIDGRVAALKAELARDEASGRAEYYNSSADRAAIAEAEYCARLIRCLGKAPYRGDPYDVALKRWSTGR